MVKTQTISSVHCRCGNPYESIFSQHIARCRTCERFEEAYDAPAHLGPPNPPNAPAILSVTPGKL